VDRLDLLYGTSLLDKIKI